jgi:hypothetical protein
MSLSACAAPTFPWDRHFSSLLVCCTRGFISTGASLTGLPGAVISKPKCSLMVIVSVMFNFSFHTFDPMLKDRHQSFQLTPGSIHFACSSHFVEFRTLAHISARITSAMSWIYSIVLPGDSYGSWIHIAISSHLTRVSGKRLMLHAAISRRASLLFLESSLSDLLTLSSAPQNEVGLLVCFVKPKLPLDRSNGRAGPEG